MVQDLQEGLGFRVVLERKFYSPGVLGVSVRPVWVRLSNFFMPCCSGLVL